jgi:hypothetical protein
MAIYQLDTRQQLVTIDSIPDFRSQTEKQFTPLSIYDHSKPDIAYAERLAEEIVNVSGAWVTVFLKEPKRDAPEDEVWDEDADPIYRSGIKTKAYFKPEPIQSELTRWGNDTPLKSTIVFSRAALFKEDSIGARLLLPGDVIEAPYNYATRFDMGPFRFRVLNIKQDGFFEYRWLYIHAVCELLTGDDALKVKTNNNDIIGPAGALP